MPVYIAGSYDFRTAYIGNRRCIMLAPTEELATLPALKKQIIKIQQIDNVRIVFELTTVSNYRRKSPPLQNQGFKWWEHVIEEKVDIGGHKSGY